MRKAAATFAQLVPTVRPDFTAFTVNLSGAQFNDLSAVTFRLYDFVPGGGQSIEFDNVTLNGTPSPAPEPHSLGLFGLGALGLVVGYAWPRRAMRGSRRADLRTLESVAAGGRNEIAPADFDAAAKVLT